MGNIVTETNYKIRIFDRFVGQDLKIDSFVIYQPLEAIVVIIKLADKKQSVF